MRTKQPLDISLIILHAFVILPLSFFLFVYTKGLLYQLTSLFLLAFLALNIYRSIRNLKLFHIPMLILLMVGFFLYTFYGLGTTDSPRTFQTLKNGGSVSRATFPKVTEIDKICYYVGIDKDVNFTLEAMIQGKWKTFYTYEKSYPFSFRWKCIPYTIATSQILLRVTKNEMMLNELRFFKDEKSIEYRTNTRLINDEPDTTIDTSYYGGMFFDEIYFARTAYEIMHGINVYENTHPYLGKLLITPGITLFGMTPFGWRFMNVIFAGLLIFMAYYFALHLFKEKLYAFGTAFLMTYSFMHLAQARIGLIDTFGVLFVFISYFYLYRFILKQQLSRLLISGVFFGLAAAVKWSAVFAALGFVLIALYLLISKYPLLKRFSGMRLLGYGMLSYGIVALFVYMLSFFDIYAHTGSFQSIINYNINMYNYHSTLQATHPYSSSWWAWPLDLKPMGYYKEVKNGIVSSINAFGNPAIFWLGIVAILYLLFSIIKYKNLEATFIFLAFIGLYVPYIFVGRLMFIYHFYYAVPFLMLAIIYMFKDAIEKFHFMRYVFIGYLFVVVGLFMAFYPVLSGYAIENTYVNHWLRWISTWWF